MFNNWHSGGGALIGSGGQLGDTPTVADSKLALSVEERITHLAVWSRALSTGSSTRQYITHKNKSSLGLQQFLKVQKSFAVESL